MIAMLLDLTIGRPRRERLALAAARVTRRWLH